MIALSDGHQCQPSLSKPRAMVSPSLPSGIGGVGRGDLGGYDGSPLRPATPIIWSFRSKNGSISSHVSGQSSAPPSRAFTPKSPAVDARTCALQWIVLPPTALYMRGVIGDSDAWIG